MHRQHIAHSALALLMALTASACQHKATLGSDTGTTNEPVNPDPTGTVDPGTPGPAPVGSDIQPPRHTAEPPTPQEIPATSATDKAPVCEDGVRLPFTPGYTPDPTVQAEADNYLRQMTIAQKVVQLTGVPYPNPKDYVDIQRSEDDTTLSIKGYEWRDGPHGVNLESGLGRRELLNYATSFPTTVSQGASFDLDVVYRMGEAMGDETVAAGYSVLLGPCMNILRHPYWGRAQETFGEDTFHLGRVASAYTEGLQQFISGCAKHYAANNIESGRFRLNANMDEQTLREVYGRHFEMVVEDGGVGCIMASYNSVNGVKATQSKHLLTEILRNDFGFKGFVLTDWWAMPAPYNGQGPVSAQEGQLVAKQALEAGLDVEVPWRMNYATIPALTESGTVPVSLVDTAVKRVLEQKIRFKSHNMTGLPGLKPPTTLHENGAITNNDHHVQLAQEGAEKGSVLLKNENNTLPIPATVSKVAVIGATVAYTVPSDNPRDKMFNWVEDIGLGDRGSSRVRPNPEQKTGALAGIQQAAPEGVEVVGGSTAAAAADADFVVVMVGLTAGDEGEEYTGASDRESLSLGPIHDTLVQEVTALGKPMVVVIQAGGVVSMPWLDSVPAVVMAWYPGQAGGAAIGRLLFGQTNFAGRLPVTWPTDVSQFPVFNEAVDGVTTTMDYYLGYRYFDKQGLTPLYAFGHGLSYSTFEYERVFAPCQAYTENSVIQLEVDVRNTSGVDGDEVVQVYASYPQTTARRSVKELKGFARVHVPAGQGVRVTIPIRVYDLKYWNGGADGSWVVEKGPVLLQVGPSSDKLLLTETVNIQ